jgi:acyl-CoA synthetase
LALILASPQRIAHYTALGWWGHTTLADLFLQKVQQHPDREAVVDPPNMQALTGQKPLRWRWVDLALAASRVLGCLRGSGLQKDDVVVVQAPNCVHLHAAYLACAMGGFIVSPITVQYRQHEIRHVLGRTQAKAVLVSPKAGTVDLGLMWQGIVQEITNSPEGAYRVQQAPLLINLFEASQYPQAMDMATLIQNSGSFGVNANDIFSVCWTSGTEATPKGVPRSHNEWIVGGRSVAEAARLPDGARLLIPFPFVNMAGLSSSLIAWLDCGGTLVHHHPWDMPVFLEQLRTEAIDYTVAAPAVLTQLLKEPQLLAGINFKKLTKIGSGGSPVSPWLIQTWQRSFGVEVINYFGSNEGAALTATAHEIADPTQRALYFPRWGVPGFDWTMSNAARIKTRLVDPDTEQDITRPGVVGELRFFGPTIISQYFKSPELTASAFDSQGFYRTGDLFEIAGEQQQFYRFAGRHKDIVIRGGQNISCEEVEQLLLAHGDIREAAVVGWPDAVMGERVCAVVVPKAGAQLNLPLLVEHLKAQGVAAFKWPEKLILSEALPRSALGKILKRELRASFATGQM